MALAQEILLDGDPYLNFIDGHGNSRVFTLQVWVCI
jgi:hypothetical protein